MAHLIKIYADGSSRNNDTRNPNMSGSFAYLILENGNILHEHFEAIGHRTNNAAELLGAIRGLRKAIELRPGCIYEVYSDSEYVVTGFNEWMARWFKANWATTTGSAVKNLELWKQLFTLRTKIGAIRFVHVLGHQDDLMNRRVHDLAQNAH